MTTTVTTGQTILIVDDQATFREFLGDDLTSEGYEVLQAERGSEARQIISERMVDAVLLDLRLPGESGMDVLRSIRKESPRTSVIMITAHGQVPEAVEAIQLGCYNFFKKPVDHDHLKSCLLGLFAGQSMRDELETLRELRGTYAGQPLIGESRALRRVLDTVAKVARSPSATILIRGETGVGKELVAQQVHLQSPRAGGPFVELNCSAIPENLLESELFGYEKGAFTDARRAKKGVFEMASGGTVFLDEIGEMSAAIQSKLLRVIETRSFRRLGGLEEVRVDTRILAATHRDLAKLVENEKFREDLYFRLNVVPVDIPPLRERGEDIMLLVRHFAERFAQELGKPVPEVSAESEQLILSYGWPGNVRELRNIIERILLLEEDTVLRPEHLPLEIRAPGAAPFGAGGATPVRFEGEQVVPLAEVERQAILFALSQTQGNKTRAASLLGISRQTLRTKLKEYALEGANGDEPDEDA
jgi:DNA-binding NtrC family response regulator